MKIEARTRTCHKQTFHAVFEVPEACFYARKFYDDDDDARSVQVRLEPDGSVFLSTQLDHVSTLQNAELTFDEFHKIISDVIALRKKVKKKMDNDTARRMRELKAEIAFCEARMMLAKSDGNAERAKFFKKGIEWLMPDLQKDESK